MKYALVTLALVAAATIAAVAAPDHMTGHMAGHPKGHMARSTSAMKTLRPAMMTHGSAKKPSTMTSTKKPSPMATHKP
jgi:hypothetical protein